MKSAHKIVPYNDTDHAAVVAAAMFEGCDTTPLVASERFIGYGNTKHGFGPACILDLAGTIYVAEPHVTWFPWTTPANRIVNFKWAMAHLAEDREVFLTIALEHKEFFDHFVKRGLLRKVGYLNNLPLVSEIHMYQYNRRS